MPKTHHIFYSIFKFHLILTLKGVIIFEMFFKLRIPSLVATVRRVQVNGTNEM